MCELASFQIERTDSVSRESVTMKFRTRAIHVGNSADKETGAVVPPVHFASTFVMPHAGEPVEFDYSRSGNPTRAALETTIAELEEGCGGLALASGMAATHAAMLILESGDHVLAGTDIYGGTYRLLHSILNRSGIASTLADSTNVEAFEQAIRPETKMIWIESPGNPLMTITDISAIAEIANSRGILLGVDSTFASPVLTRPLTLGADIVMHSATKYLSGHSDVLGGVVVVKDQELLDRLYFGVNATGAVMSPLSCFLTSRGIKTLQLRVLEQSRSALELAEFLDRHPKVTKVNYPGLSSHPGHEIAKRQMDGGFGAMLSFELAGDFEQAKKFVESTKLFQLAVSLGAVESLIEQPASMSHASYAAEDRVAHGIGDGLVRLSVGLEDVEDLKDDLQQAMDISL